MYQKKIAFPEYVEILLPPGSILEASREMSTLLDWSEIQFLEDESEWLFKANPNDLESNLSKNDMKESSALSNSL